MYNHADQSWKNKPRFLSDENQHLLAFRLKEYVAGRKLNQLLVIFHGGEPLLFGSQRLVRLATMIRSELTEVDCQVDFGVQTNGVLLKKEDLILFSEHNISVSLSIDGPERIHNQFRLNHQGKPSFDKVYQALQLLKQFPSIFTGCLSVVNPLFPPKELFSFFDTNGIQSFNILLPDANYLSPPAGRDLDSDLYKNWLVEAFDCWFEDYPHISCAFFESIIRSLNGEKGHSDALGLGDVSLLNIETDGSYHDLDVLKITSENSSDLGLHLETNSIEQAETAEKIQLHRKLLTLDGLSSTCRSCKFAEVCGGGSVPHRFGQNGYENPTIYCREMYALIDHIQEQVTHELNGEFTPYKVKKFWDSETSEAVIENLKTDVVQENLAFLKQNELDDGITISQHRHHLLHPLFYTWRLTFQGMKDGALFHNLDGKPMKPDELDWEKFSSSTSSSFHMQEVNELYIHALGKQFLLEFDPETFNQGLKLLREALDIVEQFRPSLHREILQVSPYIFMIRDADLQRDSDLSFSDETLPGAIFIGLWSSGNWLSAYQIAESIIHEHLHQKLYLLQRKEELFLPQDVQIYSPWPKQYRSPVGVVHAVYVFVHVVEYLDWVLSLENNFKYAEEQYQKNMAYLDQCANEIEEKVSFTSTGQVLWDCIYDKFRSFTQKLNVLN